MTKTILLAEDSLDDEFFFKRVLKAARLQNPVRVVHDGVELKAYLKGQGVFADRGLHPRPAVLFLDLHMPRVSGREVLEWLQHQPDLRDILTVVLTAAEESKSLQDFYSLGAHTFLPKPCKLADLETLMKHFAGYWMREEIVAGERV